MLALSWVVALIAACAPPPRPAASGCIDFEAPLVVGTQYGTPSGLAPGAVAFTASGIPVSLDKLTWAGGGSGFNYAQVDAHAFAGAAGQSLRLNNVSAEFAFPAGITSVTLAFEDLGGIENLAVNGSAPYVGNIESAPATIGGASVSVTTAPTAGGKTGTLTVTGSITSLLIGGQEFWIDNVCFK
jgi:hypothetical protein